MISRVLAAISPKFRQCLMLRLEGYSNLEIAEKVGISEASVVTYVSTARRHFRKLYQQMSEGSET
jgi:DNA-directed RNA polymerase specialized sigma24 family protein